MAAYALTTDGRALQRVERALRRYLPGLDVRLVPTSPRQALLAEHVVRALEIEYGDARPLLAALGVERALAVGDDEAVALLRTRDVAALPPRRAAAPVEAGIDWHLARCRVPEAWALLGERDTIDWSGVTVGQIDTGYTAHPAFGFPGGTWIDTANAATLIEVPFPDGATLPVPEPGGGVDTLAGANGGHGTKIGATLAGWLPGEGYFGVAPRVPLVPVRITDAVLINGVQREFAQAVRHLVDVARVGVINVSLGIFPPLTIAALRRAIDHAYDRGVIMVCAAGNYVSAVVPPARLARTLAVGGITVDDVPWSGSSHGPQVDLSAPAADIRRAVTSRQGRFGIAGGGDGTSYATAMVAGAAALWLAHRRDEIAAAYARPWQRVEAFKALAKASTRKPAGWQGGSFGDGVLDAKALLEAPLPAAATLVEDAAA